MIESHNHNGIRPIRDLVMELVEVVNEQAKEIEQLKRSGASVVSATVNIDNILKGARLKRCTCEIPYFGARRMNAPLLCERCKGEVLEVPKPTRRPKLKSQLVNDVTP
jgi:predicted Zn-ribbon and HTH transcriptional regulator